MDQFLEISASIGHDITLVQGSGGNVSEKKDGWLRIKASGCYLSDALTKNIFSRLPVDSVWTWLHRRNEELPFECVEGPLRPSIETPLHVLMPHPYVIHVHCVNCIAYSISSPNLLSSRLKGLDWQWVPYARPGLDLALAVQQVIQQHGSSVLILANHGLVVGGGSMEKARDLVYDVKNRLESPQYSIAGSHADYSFLRAAAGGDWEPPLDDLWQSMALVPSIVKIVRQAPFYPDHVVFLGPVVPFAKPIESAQEASRRIEKEAGFHPHYLIYPGKGLLVSKRITDSAKDLLTALALVATHISGSETVRPLSASAIKDLIGWDAELYRQSIAR